MAPMRFEWDAAKAASNLIKHRVSFDYVMGVFVDAGLIDQEATRPGDEEARRKAIGMIEGRVFTVVYTMRGNAVRIISARRSNDKEKRSYGSSSPHTRSE
jgi:uncharacterized DUF497 family protein